VSNFAFRSRGRGRRGTTTLEWALVGGPFFLFLLGAIELGRYQITAQSVRYITGEAARFALLDNSLGVENGTEDCATPKTKLAKYAPMLKANQLTLCVLRSRSGNITTVHVRSAYPFSFILPALVAGVGTRSITETVRESFQAS
jgi:Flp pilus assembly protein TadG